MIFINDLPAVGERVTLYDEEAIKTHPDEYRFTGEITSEGNVAGCLYKALYIDNGNWTLYLIEDRPGEKLIGFVQQLNDENDPLDLDRLVVGEHRRYRQ